MSAADMVGEIQTIMDQLTRLRYTLRTVRQDLVANRVAVMRLRSNNENVPAIVNALINTDVQVGDDVETLLRVHEYLEEWRLSLL